MVYCLDPSAGQNACATHSASAEGTRLVKEAALAPTDAQRDDKYRELYEQEAPFASGTARAASGLINLTPAGFIEVAPLK
jgi:hypothetical protein